MNRDEAVIGNDTGLQNQGSHAITHTSRSMVGGTMIVTGTAIGAGMFSLPTVSSGMWFSWSVAVMLLTWFCMLHVSLFILEVNLNYKEGASFDTFVKGTLGPKWNVINGILLTFIFYILLYAYISGGGSIVSHTIQVGAGITVAPVISGSLFALCLAFVVWLSTKAVDRIVSIFMAGMVISFLLSVGDLVLSAKLAKVFVEAGPQESRYLFVFSALPFYLTSFGFQTTVPSLVKYYGKNPIQIRRCLAVGSLLVFVIYLLWQIAVFGNVSRTDFQGIVSAGGNIGALVSTIARSGDTELMSKLLNVFANFAIVTSFLGVSLGLFDFIADRFDFSNTSLGRLKTSLVTFIPPLICALSFPDGFLYAIGYAGLALAISAVIIPSLMIIKKRKSGVDSGYRVWGGRYLAYFILFLGLGYVSCDILAMFGLLPVYGGLS